MNGPSAGGSAVLRQDEWRIDVERNQRTASVRIEAPTVTAPELAQLADLLDWLLTVGSTDISVDLGGLANVDAALLEVLHAVQARLQGSLTATARRQDAHRTLFLMGLSDSA